MTDQQFEKAKELKKEISNITDFLYAVDKCTVGTIGHTKYCEIWFIKGIYSLFSKTNNRTAIITVPKEIVLEIGEIAKRELQNKINELDNL